MSMPPEIRAALLATREVALAMRARIDKLRQALKTDDNEEILRCAREVVGLETEPAPPRRKVVLKGRSDRAKKLSKKLRTRTVER